MRTLSKLVVAALFTGALGACAPTTQIVSQWKAPGPTPTVLDRPLVVFQTHSETLRRVVEDGMAARIPGAVAAYTVLPGDEARDVQHVRDKVRQAGFDTIIVARMLNVDHRYDAIAMAPPMVGPLWSAWDYGYLNEPVMQQTTVVTLETLVYTLDPQFGGGNGELVFATASQTFDPRTVKDLSAAIVHTSMTAMSRQGVAFAGEPVRQ